MQPCPLQPLVKSGQRGSEIVRNVAADLAQAVHQVPDAVQHAVQRGREAVKVVARALHRDAPGMVAFNDGLGRAGDCIHTVQEAPAQQHATADAEQPCQAHGPAKGGGDRLLNLGDAAEVITDYEQQPTAEPSHQGAHALRSAVVLAGRGHFDDGPSRPQCDRRGQFAGKVSAIRRLYEIVERASAMSALPHHAQQPVQATLAEFITQEAG